MNGSKRKAIKGNVRQGGDQGRGNEERTHRWDWGGVGRGHRRHWVASAQEGLWGLSHRENRTWERMCRIGIAFP